MPKRILILDVFQGQASGQEPRSLVVKSLVVSLCYNSFKIQNVTPLHTECICVLCVALRINGDFSLYGIN